MINRLKFTFGLLALLLIGLGAGRQVQASSPQGITVSPAFQQVSVAQGSSGQPVTFTITNDKTTSQTVSLSVADFNTLDESGGLFFVGTKPTQLQQKYGLAKWVSLPTGQLTIAAKQTVSLKAQILNLPTLAAGGHYGALMVALGNKPGAGKNTIGIQPIASSLLFVTKLGGETYKLDLTNVYVTHNFFSLPASLTLRFRDTGNTHLIPRGVATITDPRGKLVSKGIINEDSGIILPQTYRRYGVPLNRVSTATIPGRYKLTINYRIDGYSQYRTYQNSFSIITPTMILLLIVAIAIMLGVIYVGLRKLKQAKRRSSSNSK